MTESITHVAFSDESNWNVGRFRSLALVSATLGSLEELEGEIRQLLARSNVREFKWKHLGGAKERFAAEKMCRFAVEKACRGQLRVDVLVWDIADSRHGIHGRDDIKNLQRMYYHVFRNVLRARWPNDAVWRLNPDEHAAMDWETVRDCLENVSERAEVDKSLFTRGRFRLRLRREFGIEQIRPVGSGEHPVVQLADLFAGLAAFSRAKFEEYQSWLCATSPQKTLFDDEPVSSSPSRSALGRFKVLHTFDGLCKERKLGVSLKTKSGLWTPEPRNPLNFWLYEPQHPDDKAPTRQKR